MLGICPMDELFYYKYFDTLYSFLTQFSGADASLTNTVYRRSWEFSAYAVFQIRLLIKVVLILYWLNLYRYGYISLIYNNRHLYKKKQDIVFLLKLVLYSIDTYLSHLTFTYWRRSRYWFDFTVILINTLRKMSYLEPLVNLEFKCIWF